jgi:hypothetical protein
MLLKLGEIGRLGIPEKTHIFILGFGWMMDNRNVFFETGWLA